MIKIEIEYVYFTRKPEILISVYNGDNAIIRQYCSRIKFDKIGGEIYCIDMFVLDDEYNKFVGSVYTCYDNVEINFVRRC